MDVLIQQCIREISRELKIDEDVVEASIRSEFSFVAGKMREYKETGETAPILLNHLGKFKIKPNRLKYLKKNDREQ